MIKLTFLGDFVCKDPATLKLDVHLKEIIRNSDLAALNFEAPVKVDGDKSLKSGPSIYQSETCPSFLEGLGINVIQMANNHIMDYGPEGVLKTIGSFHNSIIIGAGERDKAYEVNITEVKGIKIGLVSFVQKEFGTLDDFAKPEDVGAAWLGYHKIPSIIAEARKKCDILVVLLHAGIENIDVPLPEWRLQYKNYIDMGADAVIASHPHVPQGWEEYKGKYIFYSLGNFFFFKPGFEHASKASKGLCVSLLIDEENTITPQIHHTRFTDTELLLYDDEKEDKYLCGLLSSEEEYEKYLNLAFETLWQDYKLYILRGLGAISLNGSLNTFIHSAYGVLKGMDVPMLLNNFQCESHRWAIERILRNKMN